MATATSWNRFGQPVAELPGEPEPEPELSIEDKLAVRRGRRRAGRLDGRAGPAQSTRRSRG